MIEVILGKPGAGKTLFATKRIISELRTTNRNIVTNAPLNVDKLNEFAQKSWPYDDLCVVQRVRILTDEELKEFWKIRGPVASSVPFQGQAPALNWVHDPALSITENNAAYHAARRVFEEKWSLYQTAINRHWDKLGDEKGVRGVLYVLDEAHIAFNARDWATIGRGALHYLSQHRKLGDDVIPITQSAGNLDKQFRSVAAVFTVLKNEYQAKYSIFKGKGRFTWKSYHKEPDDKAMPFQWGSFQFNGEEQCYDTARGIGVAGNKADIGKRAKGIPIVFAIPMLIVGILAIYFGAMWAMKKAIIPAKEKPKEVASSVPPAPEASKAPPEIPKPEMKTGVYPVSYAVGAGGAVVVMSDGEVIKSGDVDNAGRKRLTAISDARIILDGQIQPFRRVKLANAPPAILVPTDDLARNLSAK